MWRTLRVVAEGVEDVHRLLARHGEHVLAAFGREAVDEEMGGGPDGHAREGSRKAPSLGQHARARRNLSALSAVGRSDLSPRLRPSTMTLRHGSVQWPSQVLGASAQRNVGGMAAAGPPGGIRTPDLLIRSQSL